MRFFFFRSKFDRLVKRIAENDSALTRVNLNGENIGDAGARKIAEAILTNTSVIVVNLRSNGIGDKGVRALAEALRHNATLATLHLGSNHIGEEGARALAQALALRHNASLAELHLGGNHIGADGARVLAEALPHNTSLAELHLWSNGIGDVGARALAEALRHNTSLTMLGLEWNDINDEVARVLADTLHFCNHSLQCLGFIFHTADEDVEGMINSYMDINGNSNGPVEAYIRKTRLFPKSHLGNLTRKSAVLPSAVERLGRISDSLSVVFCFVRETHMSLLAYKNGAGIKKSEEDSRF